MTLETLFLESGVQSEDLDKARAYQQKYGGRLEQILVNMGGLASEALPQIYSKLLGFDTLDASAVQAWEPPESIDDYPLDFLVTRGWLPYQLDENVTVYASRAPLDLEVKVTSPILVIKIMSFTYSLLLRGYMFICKYQSSSEHDLELYLLSSHFERS